MGLTELDKQIADQFRKTPNYSATGRALDIPRARIERRILNMRAAGIELPERVNGFSAMSPEKRRELGRIGGRKSKPNDLRK